MRKFINVLSHPTFIVLYFKDKIYQALLYVLFFFIVVSSLLALYDFNNKHFNSSYSKALTKEIVNYDKEIDLVFNDNKLEGSATKISTNGICAYFLPKSYTYSESVVLIFKESEVMVVYDMMFEYHISYEKINVPNLVLNDVKNNDIISQMYFESIINESLKYLENDAKTIDFVMDVVHLLILYAFAIAMILVTSFFVNPAIEFKYRINIALYDSIIFFVVMIISLLFNIVWLQYVALFLAMVYARYSFRSIVRVR